MIEGFENARVDLEGFRRRALTVGLAALAAGTVGALVSGESREQFFKSYLLAYIFWIAIPLGCLAILMLQHMSGGVWGMVTRRVLESSTRTFPLLALLFLPLLFGLRSIFPWASPEKLAASPALNHAVLEHWFLHRARGFLLFCLDIGDLRVKPLVRRTRPDRGAEADHQAAGAQWCWFVALRFNRYFRVYRLGDVA